MEDLPPGFRFYPTEEELVSFYLCNKLDGSREDVNQVMDRIIPVLDIYDFNPWDLPRNSGEVCHGDPEQWFFFIPRQESEARGGRPRRLTTTGYWKATGSPSYVFSSNPSTGHGAIGLKRTMVFYTGRAPNGNKTEWKMNEYKSIEAPSSSSNTDPAPKLRQEFSLCRVYKKLKCLRAYDRRPSSPGEYMHNVTTTAQLPTATQLAAVDHQQGSTYEAPLSYHSNARNDIQAPNPNNVEVERTQRTSLSSPGSSSSGDSGQLSHSAQSIGSSPMDIKNIGEPLWELDQLEQLNWY